MLIDHKKRLLLLKRTDNGCWGPPGGSAEPGEKVEEAARRETFEETGLKVGDMRLFGVFSGPELFYRYPNGDEVYNVSIVYISDDLPGQAGEPVLELNHEHSEWRWFAAGDIPENISPPMSPTIEKFKQIFS